MNDGDEAHDPPRRPPQQIVDPILKGDIFLPIDRALGLLECRLIGEE